MNALPDFKKKVFFDDKLLYTLRKQMTEEEFTKFSHYIKILPYPVF